jgi:hypothetical protein
VKGDSGDLDRDLYQEIIQDLPVDKETKAAVKKFLKGNKNRSLFLKLIREQLCDNSFMDNDQAEREPFQDLIQEAEECYPYLGPHEIDLDLLNKGERKERPIMVRIGDVVIPLYPDKSTR